MEILLVILITLAAVALFITERYPADLVGLLVLGALLILYVVGPPCGWIDPAHWISPSDGVSGFSNPAVITVAAMFVLSAGLQRSGALDRLGRLMMRAGGRPFLLLLLLLLFVPAMSAFVNNTAAVAVLLPMLLSVCQRRNVAPSKLLIPLSFAAQFGGVCTLIGSSTNLLVSAIAAGAGLEPIGMFELTRMGVILVLAGTAYFVLIGWWLLPNRPASELTAAYRLGEYIAELKVLPGSPLIGKTLVDAKLGEKHDATVLEILRGKETLWSPLSKPVQVDDLLLIKARVQDLLEMKTAMKLEILPDFHARDSALSDADHLLAEALLLPGSTLAGRTLMNLNFRRRFNVTVLAIRTRTETLRRKLNTATLNVGDALLLFGPRADIDRMRRDPNFVILQENREPSMERGPAPLGLTILLAVVVLAAAGVVPILISSLLGAIAMVITRCLNLDEAYRSIDWRVIFLLAALLPLGLAMEKSGASALLANQMVELALQSGPTAVLGAFYILTAVLTAFMSNNAAAVLIAPLALSTGAEMGIDPRPLLVGVCLAASTTFATPVGYQTNTMVYGAGGYRFGDFVRVGLPLNVLFAALSIWWIPRFWPF